MRVRFDIELSLSENSTEAKDIGNATLWKGVNDLMNDGSARKITLAGSASNVEVNLNGLSAARLIGIKTNKTITIKKNSTSGEPWSIQSLGTGALDGIYFITTAGITSLYLSNSTAETASVILFLAGTI